MGSPNSRDYANPGMPKFTGRVYFYDTDSPESKPERSYVETIELEPARGGKELVSFPD